MRKSIYLNETENQAIRMLADGKHSRAIREACGFTGPAYAYNTFCMFLRKKTGIHDSQSVEQCRAYLAKLDASPENPQLSPIQARLLDYILEQVKLSIVAVRHDLTESEAKAHVAQALETMGIFAIDPATIRMQIRMFFAIHGRPFSEKKPLSPEHKEIIRILSEGGNTEEVALCMKYTLPSARLMMREACLRASITCPGKGAQQMLAKLYLEARTPAQPVTLDDPAFN